MIFSGLKFIQISIYMALNFILGGIKNVLNLTWRILGVPCQMILPFSPLPLFI